jgi:hypothetical protein
MAEKLKRYLLFSYVDYYPCGGWNDFEDSFDDLDKAKAAAMECLSDSEYIDLIDSETGEDMAATITKEWAQLKMLAH